MSFRRVVALLAVALLAVGAAAGAATPDDPLLDRAYHLGKVRAFQAWPTSRGERMIVAVVDTGVDPMHEDLRGRVLPGVDLIENDDRPTDPNGHGTLVAGIVAAIDNNGEGSAGVAPSSRILPVRVLDEDGQGRSDVVADGIRWAADNGADVINLSLADEPGQPALTDVLISDDVEAAITEAWDRGIFVAAAAGNDGQTETPYGSDVPAVIVGATDRDDAVWAESNYDARTLFAPGVRIPSSWRSNGYALADGTSFATPVVSAAAAILMAEGRTAVQVRRRLIATAVDVGAGHGRIDIAAAVGTRPRAKAADAPKRPPARPSEPPSSSTDEEPSEPKRVEPFDRLDETIQPLEVPAEQPGETVSPVPQATPSPPVVKKPKPAAVRPSPPAAAPQLTAPPLAVAPVEPAPSPTKRSSSIPWLALAAVGLIVIDAAALTGWLKSRRTQS